MLLLLLSFGQGRGFQGALIEEKALKMKEEAFDNEKKR